MNVLQAAPSCLLLWFTWVSCRPFCFHLATHSTLSTDLRNLKAYAVVYCSPASPHTKCRVPCKPETSSSAQAISVLGGSWLHSLAIMIILITANTLTVPAQYCPMKIDNRVAGITGLYTTPSRWLIRWAALLGGDVRQEAIIGGSLLPRGNVNNEARPLCLVHSRIPKASLLVGCPNWWEQAVPVTQRLGSSHGACLNKPEHWNTSEPLIRSASVLLSWLTLGPQLLPALGSTCSGQKEISQKWPNWLDTGYKNPSKCLITVCCRVLTT